jgi:membrane AbrB-like protein
VRNRGRRWQLLDWAVVVAGAVAVSLALETIDIPSSALFGGLVAGLVRALAVRTRLVLPRAGSTLAQAVIGVAIGALLQVRTLAVVAEHWLPVLLVTVGTLVLSLAAGQVLRLLPGISSVTGAFSMIAGGASGITVMAHELGADERMVAVLQYLRVLLIVVLMPVVATAVYGASSDAGGPAHTGDGPGWPVGALFTVGCVGVGLVLGRLSRIPLASLLGPLVVAAAADLSGLAHGAEVPDVFQSAAFLVIGLQVGITFTLESLRTVGRALPLAMALIVSLVLASAGMGALLTVTAGVSPLDGYLATTPGGMNAVLATATDSGADATFVVAVQVLRLFVMLLSAPLVARVLRRPGAG